jgi:hypothetical protein
MEEKRLKVWIVDRLAEGKFDGVKNLHYYVALFTRSAWSGFKEA